MTTTPIPSPLAPYSAARAALTTINDMINCDCPRDHLNRPITRNLDYDCMHDIASTILRDLLCIDDDDSLDAFPDCDYSFFNDAAPLYAAMRTTLIPLLELAFRTPAYANETYNRDALSAMRLDFSLCPLHATDYAICFDDDDAECASIRTCFPSHDT